MKAVLFVLVLFACMVFSANAGVVVREDASKEFHWENPAGKPLTLSFEDAIRSCPELSEKWKERIIKAFPYDFHVVCVRKGCEREDWMLFGDGKIEHNVLNSWRGRLFKNGVEVGDVPEESFVWENTFLDTVVQRDSISITRLRIRKWYWCNNISGTTTEELAKKELPPSMVHVVSKKEIKKEPEKVESRRTELSFSWIMEASHWNNDQNPLIRYEEGKIGLRVRWLPLEGKNLNLEADGWLVGRAHSVVNGEKHSLQTPLFQVQPKASFSPTWWSFVMVGDAVTFSKRGRDTNTALALIQVHLAFMDQEWFEPMLQFAGSITDSWPRYLSCGNQYPESRAQYREIGTRFQLARFGSIRTGWELKWFDFAKTRVDPKLATTSELCYLSRGHPLYGGPFVQIKMPLEIYADLSLMREHIDSEAYITSEEGSHWIPGKVAEWRVNLVISRGFRMDLFR